MPLTAAASPSVLKPGVAALLARVDTIVFDMDGVLLDISGSIRQVNLLSVPAFLRTLPGWSAPDDLLRSEDIERFKNAGGFNDDWDLTYAAVLLFLFKAERYDLNDAAALGALSPTIPEFTDAVARNGGWLRAAESWIFGQLGPDAAHRVRTLRDTNRIRRIFQELYAGDLAPRLYGFTPQWNTGPGKVRGDRPLLDLARLPEGKTLAVLTGRTLAEAEVGLEMTGLAARIPLPARGITKNDEFYKPEPYGMRALLTRLNARTALYVGDALDDLRTVLAFRTLPEAAAITLLSAQVLTGTAGPDAPHRFADADILAPDVNAVLDLLRAA